MKNIKIDSKQFYSFKNGVKIEKERIQKWLDEILKSEAEVFKQKKKLKFNLRNIASGDSTVIVSLYRIKKGKNKFYLNIWVSTSEGYSHCEIEKFKLW